MPESRRLGRRYLLASVAVLALAILVALFIPNGHALVRARSGLGPHPDCIGSGPCFVIVTDHRLETRLALIALGVCIFVTGLLLHRVGPARASGAAPMDGG
jgi:hypothetical protein